MERKKFYGEIYKDIIWSVQEFEDGNISERYDCCYHYFLDHEDIISQYSTFNFSNERCFGKSALDRVAKCLLPEDCHALFPVLTIGEGNYLILLHCCLLENNLSFRQNCELNCLVRWSRTGL